MMAFRRSYRFVVQYKQAGKAIAALSRLQAVERERGWSESRLFTPTPGVLNEFVHEADFEDRAAHDAENEARAADEACGAAWADLYPLVVAGTFVIEYLDGVELGD
jgi:hypothetical protein